jgi:heme exporter protein C
VAGAFVPLNFLAVRMAQSVAHPRVLTTTGGNMPGSMFFTFLVSMAGIACLYVTLCKYELASKSARMQLRRLRRALLEEEDRDALPRRSAAPV